MDYDQLKNVLLLGKLIPVNLEEQFPKVNGLRYAAVYLRKFCGELEYQISIDGTLLSHIAPFVGAVERISEANAAPQKKVYAVDEYGNVLDGEEDL